MDANREARLYEVAGVLLRQYLRDTRNRHGRKLDKALAVLTPTDFTREASEVVSAVEEADARRRDAIREATARPDSKRQGARQSA